MHLKRGLIFGVKMMACAGSCMATPAFAGLTNGYVSPIVTEVNNATLTISNVGTNRPACATVPTVWVFDMTTARGQSLLAVALTSLATGRPITVSGTNTCDASGREFVQYIALYQ